MYKSMGQKPKKFKPKDHHSVDSGYSDIETHIKYEKQKARQLRHSSWWKNKIATGICYYCGRKFKPSELTMDHVIPLSRGGHSEKINIVACCKECNTKKKSLLPFEWEEYIQNIKKGHII